tara:strand:- start:1930 stop:2202 length:273 start_codon:yes stop_codon:yes gene_type:complete
MKTENEVKENKFINWLKKLWYEEYTLTIWFAGRKVIDEKGREEYVRTPKKYEVAKMETLKPHLIKFEDLDGQEVEIRSEEPMNWDLVKRY